PQRVTWKIEPVREGWNRSAAQTPNWHVNEESTRIVVFAAAKVTLSFSVWIAHSPGTDARSVKYIAKRPAKNMSSLASHTIVPTDTGFGRLTTTWARGAGAVIDADTLVIMADFGPRWGRSGGRAAIEGARRPGNVPRFGGDAARRSSKRTGSSMVDGQGSDVTHRTGAPRVLLYSDDADTRERVRLAVGARIAKGEPKIEWVETATHDAVITHADAGGF